MKRGFNTIDPARQREIARLGGLAVPAEKRSFAQDPKLAQAAGRVGGSRSGGNFAKDRVRAAEAGRKGGKASGGNFARNILRAANAGKKSAATRRAKQETV